MLPHPSTGKSGQAPHCALSCCSRMVCKDTTQAQDWAIYLPAFPQFHPTIHLLGRQTMPFSRWQHGRDTVGCCGPHGDEYRQPWLSLTSPRLKFHGSGHLWQCLKSSLCSFGIFFSGEPQLQSQDKILLSWGRMLLLTFRATMYEQLPQASLQVPDTHDHPCLETWQIIPSVAVSSGFQRELVCCLGKNLSQIVRIEARSTTGAWVTEGQIKELKITLMGSKK